MKGALFSARKKISRKAAKTAKVFFFIFFAVFAALRAILLRLNVTDRKAMKKIKIPANTIWESTVGYSRAIRIDDFIVVAGTAPVENDEIVATGNAYEQAKFTAPL